MEETEEVGVCIFQQNGVWIQSSGVDHEEQSLCSGQLEILKYSHDHVIEWKPQEEKALSVEPGTNDQEWSVVNTMVNYKVQNGDADSLAFHPRTRRAQQFSVNISDLKSYKLSKNAQQLILMQKDGTTHSALHFSCGNATSFITELKRYIKVRHSKKDKSLYLVVDKQMEVLNRSFSELNIFMEHPSDHVWKFFRNLHERPVETTLTAFSKVSDYILWKPPEEGDHRPTEKFAELLQESLSALDTPLDTNHEDGYEVVGTPGMQGLSLLLPPRPEVRRSQPLSVEEWTLHMDQQGRMPEEDQLRQKIFRGGLHNSLRYEAWKFLLGYFPFDSTHCERQEIRKKKVEDYFMMKQQWRSITEDQEKRFSGFRDRKALIEKDVLRTDRTITFYEGDDNPNVQMLNDILMTYVMYNFDLGYVQGMSDLLSPILYVMQNEVDAFWCFVAFMDRVDRNFEMEQEGMKEQLLQLKKLLHTVDPILAAYLDKCDSSNLFFCFRWLLILFKREFSYPDIMLLWEVLWTDLPCPNFHLLICLAILDTEKATLMENKYEFTEILKHINDISMQIHLEDTLAKAEAIYLQLKGLSDLPDSVRSIIGLPLKGSEGVSSLWAGDGGAVCSSPPSWKLSSKDEPYDASESSIEVISEPDEAKYERAISLQYL